MWADEEQGEPPDETPTHWLWPENQQAWRLWCLVQTQWRVGMADRTGLDHTAVWATLRELVQRRPARQEIFEDIAAMERATLEEWARRRPKT